MYKLKMYCNDNDNKQYWEECNDEVSDELLCVNLHTEKVNLMGINNRRFMYHLDGWLILGIEDVKNAKKILKSHAEEYYEASCMVKLPPFDEFVRGWIGVGNYYPKGIIHFAPHIPETYVSMFDKAFSFIEETMKCGFTSNAVLRGFPGAWEQKIAQVIPDKLTKKAMKVLYGEN